ncbi:Transcriptional regulator, MerR family [Labilithrix luteola]|uniref:S-adenosyl-L-methionine-dependent methyltransferase n=2 Tax=Labilithrix luteola TaxID=1391654 RepID=A0A0K1Q4F3_9BACT|nr:Transcriptional regulator, MerR family [Labilithrix luteola]
MGRAVAHGRSPVARFDDPTAIELLAEESRERVRQVRAGAPVKGLRANLRREYLQRQSTSMVARTVAIDDEVRAAASPQVVILGAGLDGRAWRMSELREVTVFEVDHPDTQRVKRSRVPTLERHAKEIRFVAVDFERDSLDEALEKAGHDSAKPTTWIWEGVVMYLARADIEKTLAVIAERSAKRSRLVIAYHQPALILHFLGPILRRIGEPLRTALTPTQMKALLDKYGFDVVRDRDMHEIGASLGAEVEQGTKTLRHQRIVAADRV